MSKYANVIVGHCGLTTVVPRKKAHDPLSSKSLGAHEAILRRSHIMCDHTVVLLREALLALRV